MVLTEIEKIILENTYDGYKYIARSKYGDLTIFIDKPIKMPEEWYCYSSYEHEFMAFNSLFHDINWSDEEPLQFRNEQGEFIL